MRAVIIVNWKYSGEDYNDLEYPQKDGELMEKLLKEGGYENIVLVQNEEDIEKNVKNLIEKQERSLERFHFHFSGKRKFKNALTTHIFNILRPWNTQCYSTGR